MSCPSRPYLSLKTSTRGRRPTSSTPCCGCWSSILLTWRSWSESERRSWRSRSRRRRSFWRRCFLRELTWPNSMVWIKFNLHFNLVFVFFPSDLWPKLWKWAAQSNQSTLTRWRFTSATSLGSPPSQPTANPSRWSTCSTTSTPSSTPS